MYDFNILEFEAKVIEILQEECNLPNASGIYPEESSEMPYVAVNTENVGMVYDVGENNLKEYLTTDISIWAEDKISAIQIRENIKQVLIGKGFICDMPSQISYDLSSQKYFTDLSLDIVYNKLSGEYERRK